jgi:KUP system potassium uptake protein
MVSSSSYLSKIIKSFKDIVQSLGLVFGDIGTSPIYTLSVVFFLTPVTVDNVLGILSLIVWTLILLVFVEYITLVMGLGRRGEGGTIVLKELLVHHLKTKRQMAFATFLSFIGISLLFGDGVLTPAMGILSALEGLKFITFIKVPPLFILLIIATFIAIFLFVLQKLGTERVGAVFGPLMFVWFLSLFISGLFSVFMSPFVFKAINPYYAVKFFLHNGLSAFFILSDVILCVTGAEAIYADMGHLGVKPIRQGSVFVFVTLLLSYLGQGAFLLQNPNTKQILYGMVAKQFPLFYLPFLLLSLFATVIASQAMISGIFSSVYQGIMTHVLPRLKVDYTSSKFRSQIYVGAVNWFLLICVIFIIWHFEKSHKLAAAYGLAVSGTMTITSIMMTWIFYLRKNYFRMTISFFIGLFVFAFFASNLFKIPHGGYWSIMLAMIPFGLMVTYSQGRKLLAVMLKSMSQDRFLEKYNKVYKNTNKIEGTGLFFVKNVSAIPPYVMQIIFKNNILYNDNILISIITRDDPFGVIGFFKGELAPGLRIFEVHMGYMEIIDIGKILGKAGINPKVIFYGVREVVTHKPLWKLYFLIKQFTPSIVQFHRLSPYKLHGVVTLVKM